MKFGFVLLGLVALTSIHVSSGQCSNGLVGVDNDDVCCIAACGTCGGRGCAGRSGGGDNCCSSRIRDSGVMCSASGAAPCIMDDIVVDSDCSNGVPGVDDGEVCCAASCGTCGGSGCSRRPGGGDNCCASRIRDSEVMCSASAVAPCIMDDIVVDSDCSNGVPGVDDGEVCCAASCGTCGGSGCSRRPGGGDNCCSSRIEDSGDLCSVTQAAPCIMDVDAAPTCTNGLPGVQSGSICCEAQCETCGGAGCGSRPGGEDGCCTSNIMGNGMNCTTTMAAPCIVDGAFPDVPVALCSNGVVGVENGGFCCEAGCGTCGGSGCSSRPGGADACCTSRIEDSQVMCDDTMMAPCIV